MNPQSLWQVNPFVCLLAVAGLIALAAVAVPVTVVRLAISFNKYQNGSRQ